MGTVIHAPFSPLAFQRLQPEASRDDHLSTVRHGDVDVGGTVLVAFSLIRPSMLPEGASGT